MILSQDATITRPSKLCTRVTNSTDIATMSRPTCSYFSSSAPFAMFPQVAGIPNSTGTPPAAQIPSFTASAICLKWADPGDPDIYEFGTPICGFLRMSSSEYPAAFIITLLCAASAPFQYSVPIISSCLRFAFSSIS